MATIRKSIDISAEIDVVWNRISDLGRISNLIGFLEDSRVSGSSRVCTLKDGATLSEQIISVNEDLNRVVYTITESPLNLKFHVAAMELAPIDNGTRLTWTVDLTPAEAAAHMEPMLESACNDMKTTLAA